MAKNNIEEWGRTLARRDRATENILLSGLQPNISELRRASDSENGRLLVRGGTIKERLFAILLWVSLIFTSALIWFAIMKLFVDWYIPTKPQHYGREWGPMNPSNVKSARDYMERHK